METEKKKRFETNTWLATYGSNEEILRRRNQLPGKLKKLGVLDEARDVQLIDLCCGHGEALDVLHEFGFRNLVGLDLTRDEKLAADSRFTLHTGSALDSGLPSSSFDVVTCVHSMHHFATPENVKLFLDEAFRILKPGGRLYILDFENSPQILLAFWFFRKNPFWFNNSYLENFARITIEEWPFLQHYLPAFGKVRKMLLHGKFKVIHKRHSLFYFFLRLEKN